MSSQRRNPPPVLVVCCGRRLQVCIDGAVQCDECGDLHWIDHGVRHGTKGEEVRR